MPSPAAGHVTRHQSEPSRAPWAVHQSCDRPATRFADDSGTGGVPVNHAERPSSPLRWYADSSHPQRQTQGLKKSKNLRNRRPAQRLPPVFCLRTAAQNVAGRGSATADFAVRAATFLAAFSSSEPLKAEVVAVSQEIPSKLLLNILSDLKRARIVTSHRAPSDVTGLHSNVSCDGQNDVLPLRRPQPRGLPSRPVPEPATG